MSGIPYVTSSAANEATTSAVIKLSFPFVTKFFTVTNTDDAHTLKFGFTENGVNGNPTDNFIILAPGLSGSYDFRVKDLFFKGGSGASAFRVVAGLTTIERNHFPVLTGTLSNGTAGYEGVG